MIEKKGGNAYGKVPERIATAGSPLLVIARGRRRCGNLEGFAEGKRIMPGPGQKPIAFRHCEERSDEAISKWAA